MLVITPAELDHLITPILKKIREKVLETLETSNPPLAVEEIKEVLLVGGSSRIPSVKNLLRGIFRDAKINDAENPDHAVAKGATIKAAMTIGARPGLELIEAIPLSIGTVVHGSVFKRIIRRNTKIPTKKYVEWYATVNDGQTEMDFEVKI